MEVIKIIPRGYCHGVVDAIAMVKRVAKDPSYPRPIHILGMIVHNRHVVEDLEKLGVINLDGPDRLSILEQINEGTVIFTAHGVSPQVRQRAAEKGLTVVDATCSDVTRTHDLVTELANEGYEILYIGKKGHPEPEGAMGNAPGKVHLIETVADVEALPFGPEHKLALTTQTTLSQWDTQEIIDAALARYPQLLVYNEICKATQLRQEAAVEQSADADLTVVVGDQRSNNSKKLVEVVQEIAGKPAVLVDSVASLSPELFSGKKRIAVTAGASTPNPVTREVIRYIENLGENEGG